MRDDLGMMILQYLCLLFSLSAHEAAHAAMANWCGDPSARLLGRMTLNPIKHIDPLGTVVLPLFAMFRSFPFLFGWAKPVPYNPRNLRNIRRDSVLIGLAGPGANLLLILSTVVVLRLVATAVGVVGANPVVILLLQTFVYLALINAVLMLFNLIPLPPLDGHHLLEAVLPPRAAEQFEKLGPFSLIILFVLVFQFHILDVPMAVLSRGVFALAFYGTPLYDMMQG